MLKQNSGKLLLIVIVSLLCSAPEVRSQSGERSPTPTPTPKETKRTQRTLRLQIEVTAGDPPEKVEGAKVYVTSEENGEKHTKDFPTSRQGIANFQVPQGKLVIQVVAKRCETFGDEYTLTEDNQTIKITLKRCRTP